MSQDEFNQKVIEHLIALGERLESIERMLGAESKQAIGLESECKIPMFDARGMSLMPDGSDPMQCGSKEITGAKLKVIYIYGDTYHRFAIRLDKEHWAACKITDHVNKWEIVKKSQIAGFGELNQEYTEEAIRRGIFECSAVEQEPEWRPMSTAPEVHIKVKSKGTGQEYFAIRKQNGRYTCSKGALLYTVEYCSHELEGWRPL